MKIFAVVSELYKCEQSILIFYDSIEKAKKYLEDLSKTYNQECVKWHQSKQLFRVASPNSIDRFYINQYEVH